MKRFVALTLFVLALIVVFDIPTDALAATKYVKVSFNSAGGSAVSAKKVAYNKLVTAPKAPKKTGYIFVGWYKESKLKTTWNFKTNRVTKNITLYAKWKINTYSVTFNSVGGAKVNTQKINYKRTIAIPKNPTKTGYTFAGWYKDSKYKSAWNFKSNTVTGNITLYAKWTPNKYTVNFYSQGGSAISSKAVTYNSTMPSPSTPTKNGYLFEGWYTSPSLTSKWIFTNKVQSGMTLYARWRAPVQSSYMGIIPPNIGSLNVRTTTNTNVSDNIIGKLTGRNPITITSDYNTTWFQINYNGKVAYISKSLMDQNNTVSAQLTAYAAYITANGSANIYTTPSSSSKVLGTVKNGAYVNVVPIIGNQDFVQIAAPGGKLGYLAVSNHQQLFYSTLDIRKPSSITAAQINSAIVNYKAKNKITAKIPIDNQGQTFIDVGKESGVNPLILAAIAMHESGWGTNNLSIRKNNIYSVGAYDKSPFDSAYTFSSIKEAIQYQANLLNQYYLTSDTNNKMYSAGNYIGTGGIAGTLIGGKNRGASGLNSYYSSNANWGADIAYICQSILPYNSSYSSAKPMTGKLISVTLADTSINLADKKVYGKNKGKVLNIYDNINGTTYKGLNNQPVQLSPYDSTTNVGTFQVLGLWGNLKSGWMKITTTVSGTTYTGYVNFGGLDNYPSRFTLDNLIRNSSTGTYAAQAPNTGIPAGYVTCYR